MEFLQWMRHSICFIYPIPPPPNVQVNNLVNIVSFLRIWECHIGDTISSICQLPYPLGTISSNQGWPTCWERQPPPHIQLPLPTGTCPASSRWVAPPGQHVFPWISGLLGNDIFSHFGTTTWQLRPSYFFSIISPHYGEKNFSYLHYHHIFLLTSFRESPSKHFYPSSLCSQILTPIKCISLCL